MRAVIFAAALAASGALIVAGVSRFSPGAGLVAAGALLAVWSWAVLNDEERR